MPYKAREIEFVLQQAADSFPVVVMTGARQSGKSTCIQKQFPKYNYVSLDELDNRQLAEEDPREFLDLYSRPLIIDEIQEAPSLLNYIKAIVDKDRRNYGQYIITGSQQFSLMKGVTESLAGRAAILDLYTFSTYELNFKKHWSKWIEQGSFPELYVNKKISKSLWYDSYIKTFLDRDIKEHLKSNYIKHYKSFIDLLLARCGQELNYADIAKDLGVDEKTVKSWLEFLERSQIIYLLKPYPRKLGKKRASKKCKIYFYDTGLVAYKLGFHTEEQIRTGPLAGAFFENLVVTELLKRKTANLAPGSLYYYREHGGLEVDLILENQMQLDLIEIKKSETPSLSMAKNLQKFSEISDYQIRSCYLCSAKKSNDLIKGVSFCYYSDLFDHLY